MNVLLSLPHLATFVSHLLEPRIATIPTIAAAAIVSCFHVSLTQSLGLEYGSQHFALQKAVVVKVNN